MTGTDGTVTVSGLKPNAIVIVGEDKAPTGYLISEGAKSVVVRSGVANALTFDDEPATTLVIRKYIEGTDYEPLAGVAFKVTDGSGAAVGPDDGTYYTDKAGEIVLTGLEPGITVRAREIKTVDGYVLDGTPQDILIEAGAVQQLTFWNKRAGALVIRKLSGADRQTPLAGAEFRLTYADGGYVDNLDGKLSSNGIYRTDSNGEIRITGVTGTIVATETRSPDGYTIGTDRTQTVVVRSGETQTLTFYNDPVGGLELIKVDEANRSKRLANATFEIRRMDQGVVTTVTTDKNGRAVAELDAGNYCAVEVEAPTGYRLNSTPAYFTITDGKTSTVTVTNKAYSGIEIHKVDAATGEGIYGAKFLLYDGGRNPVAEAVSDQDGYARFEGLTLTGRVYLKELECEGYQVDTQLKTVSLRAGKTTRIEWKNTPITGQIQIYKYAGEFNSITGTVPGASIAGAVYEIVDVRSGKVVDQIVTDARGVAASKPLPLKRYQVKEISAPMYWRLSDQVFDVTLEFVGQIIKVTDFDKPAALGIALTKTGIREVLAGNQTTYTFTVANTSNVPLSTFYFHDKLPYDVTSATAITTGTYSQRLSYRILYKTNMNDYRVLASNLLSTNNYAFRLTGLPLMAGEVVTDIYYDFGTVPAGFQSVTKPTLTVTVNPGAVNGYQVVNRADAGGQYGGTWQSANAAWVTIVRNLTPVKRTPLPKTGY